VNFPTRFCHSASDYHIAVWPVKERDGGVLSCNLNHVMCEPEAGIGDKCLSPDQIVLSHLSPRTWSGSFRWTDDNPQSAKWIHDAPNYDLASTHLLILLGVLYAYTKAPC